MYTVYLESNKKHKLQTSTSLSRRSFSNKLLSLSSFFLSVWLTMEKGHRQISIDNICTFCVDTLSKPD